MLYVFTGKGKGKTTAAIGSAIRALGAQKKVLFCQFLKPGNSSEFKILNSLDGFKGKACGRKGFFLPPQKLEDNPELEKRASPLEKIDKRKAREGLNWLRRQLSETEYGLIVLDEVNLALDFDLLEVGKVLDLVSDYSQDNFIFTGRKAPIDVIKQADLVTKCKEIKHPYRQGKDGKEGIEY